eukprot:CAMPEP_0202728538 /NCGR_PEP_ID=MMETSP1385-20130828/185677_1 /ASSEMBLY_ACC=CAM_ASM_000861 /TAXON_ID=933848 /ORGANISM="Elphidium margaritaceum" /LENGTH=589 /DNA_ID=CAMNT_0049394789 /DNA_START=21 /DNA_END=1787 /DNA_ORIENTATION=+
MDTNVYTEEKSGSLEPILYHDDDKHQEEMTVMVHDRYAMTFVEHGHAPTTIIVDAVLKPLSIEFNTKLRSSVDVGRLISHGATVRKVDGSDIADDICLSDFEALLDEHFKLSQTKPVSVTVLKCPRTEHGTLMHSTTVKNAMKWKREQYARYQSPRNALKRKLDSLYVQIFIFALILVDLTLFAMYDRMDSATLAIVTFTILGIYLVEILLRIYAKRPEFFFKDPLEALDLTVVIASCLLSLVQHSNAAVFVRAARSLRAFRALRIFRSLRVCVRSTKTLRNAPQGMRILVRLNKQGFHDETYDLDLCYVTANVLAMSLPSTGFEQMYRNPIADVAAFMDEHHGTHYMIFDLCLERSYDRSVFHGRVTHYKFQDHGVPTISAMHRLCLGVQDWLQRHEANVVAIHCKGGKGRTGTMICAWLLFRYPEATPDEAIDLFATMRTNHLKARTTQGIETYSQRRYVEYFHRFVHTPSLLNVPPYQGIAIRTIDIGPLYLHRSGDDDIGNGDDNALMSSSCQWSARIIQRDEDIINVDDTIYEFGRGVTRNDGNAHIVFESTENGGLRLLGNICVLVYRKQHDDAGNNEKATVF